MRGVKYVLGCLAVLVLVAGSYAAGFGTHVLISHVVPSAEPTASTPSATPSFDVFWQAWELAKDRFVDTSKLDDQKMMYGAIEGMLDSLGDGGHTRFMTAEEYSQQTTSLSGEFSGIGAQIGVRDGRPVIVAPMDNSPAFRAGITAGDILLKVDGTDVTEMSTEEIVTIVRGPKGTTVTLSVIHPNGTGVVDISIVRDTIKVVAVTWSEVPGTGLAHIRISEFSENATSGLRAALKDIQSKKLKGAVIDIRSNPGGLLDQAVGVASQFLRSGNVVLERNRAGQDKPQAVLPGGAALDLPIVVLINFGSASASEIVAGAIQDQSRGVLMGETTFGTGTILSTYRLSDGSAILLGTSEWFTPNGRAIRQLGISPDIQVTLPVDGHILLPEQTRTMTLDDITTTGDAQLARALQELAGTGQ